MDESKCGQATPHGTLIEHVMNASLAKSEREWAAAIEIETLRQRVKELENERDEWIDDEGKAVERCVKAETELATLKQAQGEPFGWYWATDYEDGIIVNDGENYDVQPNWTPLYTAPPTVAAERAISDKLEKAIVDSLSAISVGAAENILNSAIAELAAMRKG